ncbi:myeloid differentiation primary response protein MyD88 [Photinus pyralis]|nr:myeloid differentiation primary response protein MyD88 [Photinus pyralis]
MAGDSYEVSIKALSTKTIALLSTLLNPPKIILTEDGLPRDWNGLAELVGISGECIPSLQNAKDHTKKLLSVWHEKDQKSSTICNLLTHLEKLDRFDVVEDVQYFIDEDIKAYQPTCEKDKLSNVNPGLDSLVLTREDIVRLENGLGPQHYDAFVLFADEDANFATELIDKMENDYKLKLCTRDRDLVAGIFEHEAIMKLISLRCDRLVPVLSPAFLDSYSNKFICSFAQSLGIEQQTRKIVPCLYTPCQVPSDLKCLFMLDYQRQGKFSNFWKRVRDSIKMVNQSPVPTSPIYRSSSQQIPQTPPIAETNHIAIVPDITHESSLLKPKKNGVKFSSMINLPSIENDEIVSSISETDSLPAQIVEVKKSKIKTGWLKKILSNKNHKCSDANHESHKKNLFRSIKRKVAIAN